MKRNRMRGPGLGWVAAAMMGGVAALGGMSGAAFAAPAPQASADEAQDVLLMTNGQELKGKILSETPTSVRFQLSIAGITTEVEYQRSQIKEVRRGKGGDAAKPAPASEADTSINATDNGLNLPPPSTNQAPDDGRVRYYYVELKGELGEDITQTPIMEALKDARQQRADVIIFYLDASWKLNPLEDAPDDAAAFDQIFRAEDIVPKMLEDVEQKWDKPPKIVFWVKNAMGGSALMPIAFPNIYMHSDGRIGGLGNLSQMMEGTGDEVVREKQRSLRLGHAEGWMIKGGYDPRIMKAMARIEYILSARIAGNRVDLFEGYPETPSDELLTDDGDKDRADTVQERVAGEGNDVLTLKPRTAQMLGVSKGTVDTKEELLYALDLTSNSVDVSSRSKKIMDGWKDDLKRAQRQLRDLLRDYAEVRVEEPGEYQERTAARGKRRQILGRMKSTIARYKEALTPMFFAQYEFPQRSADGMENWINVNDESIKLQQMQDRK